MRALRAKALPSEVYHQRHSELLTALGPLLRPIGPGTYSQCPRPWMTDGVAPWAARVFTVGLNQHNPYLTTKLPTILEELYPGDPRSLEEKYIASLINSPPGRCRAVYERCGETPLAPHRPSVTRTNTECLVDALRAAGIGDVLQTNVICYATPMGRDLRRSEHHEGAERGLDIFRTLVGIIRPRVIVAHGAKTSRVLARALSTNGERVSIPRPQIPPTAPLWADSHGIAVFVIPSLAPPAFNMWRASITSHLDAVCQKVREILDEG